MELEANMSENNLWDTESLSQNSDTLSTKQVRNVRCKVCNRKQETLAKREEIAWQREDVIHTREKELREWELMLEDKNQQLVEKERQFKYSERRVMSVESICNSERNSRKTSISNIDLKLYSTEQDVDKNSTDVDKKNNFILEKEKLLHEQRNVIIEKTRNIEQKEQNLILKEQILNNQKAIFDKERELIVKKNVDLQNREKVVKNIEESLEGKLKDTSRKIKLLDDRKKLLDEKENALSKALELMQSREHILNEREQAVIEKENSIIKQISDFVSKSNTSFMETEYSSEVNQELLRKLDEMFDDKWKSVQQRENVILQSESTLQENLQEFSRLKELFQSEEENLLAMKATFEKENAVLREWENLLKQENEVTDKSRLIEKLNTKKGIKSISTDINESSSHLCQDTLCSTEKDKLKISSNEFRLMSDNECDLEISTTNNIEQFQCGTSCSEDQKISGNELFQCDEKENKLLQMSLTKENSETYIEDQVHSNTKENVGLHCGLNDTVLTFFKNTVVLKTSNETNKLAEISKKSDQSTSSAPDVRNGNDVEQENTQSFPVAPNLKNVFIALENVSATKNTVDFSDCGISISKADRTNHKSDHDISSSCTIEKIEEDNSREKIGTKKIDVIENGEQTTSNVSLHSASETIATLVPKHETEHKSKNSDGNNSGECGKSGNENDSCLKNGKINPHLASSKISCNPPNSSASSTRSLTSPISGRCSPCVSKRQRKPARDALLNAIKQRNSLETVRLLDTNFMSLELRNDDGRSAILLAVEYGNIELVERLIKKGANIRACDYKGNSALHIAVETNNPDMVIFLLKKGLNPLVTDVNGNTVLQLASNLKLTSLIEIINNFKASAK